MARKATKVSPTGGRSVGAKSFSPFTVALVSLKARKLSRPGTGMACTRLPSFFSSGICSRYMGALLLVSQWDSMAASLVGWNSATRLPCRWPTRATTTEKVSAKTAPMRNDLVKKSTLCRRSRCQAEMPTTKKPARAMAPVTVWKNWFQA